MAEDLTNMWQDFNLSEGESVEVVVQQQAVEEVATRGNSCLVGKLIADRIIGKDTIRAKMLQKWRPSGSTSFKVIGENLFLIDFEYSWDKSRVLEGRPWTFEGSLLSLEEFDGLTPPTEIPFDKAAFWVRMFNLPLACMGQAVGFQIGSTLGTVEEVETDDEGLCWGKYLRVRVKIDLTKPISRGRRINLSGNTVWVPFQYERLPHFCFLCGKFRHGMVGCSGIKGAKPQFGLWLRVSPSVWQKDSGRQWFGNQNRDNGSPSRSPMSTSNPHGPTKVQQENGPPVEATAGMQGETQARAVLADRRTEMIQFSSVEKRGSGMGETVKEISQLHGDASGVLLANRLEIHPGHASHEVEGAKCLVGSLYGNNYEDISEEHVPFTRVVSKGELSRQKEIPTHVRGPTVLQNDGRVAKDTQGESLGLSGNYEASVLYSQAVKEPKDKGVVNWKRRARAEHVSAPVQLLFDNDGKRKQDDYLGGKLANVVGQVDTNVGIRSKKIKSGSGVAVADFQPRQPR
jgi:hypothetical protein